MDNKKRLLKELRSILLASTFAVSSLSGCGKTDSNENINTTQVTTIESTTKVTTNATSESAFETTTEMTTEVTTTEATTQEITTQEITTTEATTQSKDIDNQILNSFNKDKDELQEAYDNRDTETLAQKGKKYFIKAVDFIFYDGEIKGVKYDDLKEESKEVLFEQLCEMDELIMTLAPNYKENISEKYHVVKDLTNKAYYYVLDKIKTALGEERYDKIGEIKDSVKEKLSDVYEKGKTKIKDWYEGFRDK